MLVSLCIIAYNEEKYLPGLFKDIAEQDFSHSQVEIILIDAMSEDGTRKIMEDFSKERTDFYKIGIYENSLKTQPTGWNVAIEAATGDVIIRVDAHSHIPYDFVSNNIRCIESGEFIAGGARPSLPENNTPWSNTMLVAETSMFGSGAAIYRRENETGKKYVNSLFHAAYRKEVFEATGGFNEKLIRTEDNELHYRMRKAGYRFCFDSSIKSYQYTRSTFLKMIRQKFQNGYWIGITTFVCPACLSIFHYVPFLFIGAIGVTGILAGLGIPVFMYLLWAVYFLGDFAMSAVAIVKEAKEGRFNALLLLLPLLFMFLHLSYGIGTLGGLIAAPFKLSRKSNG